MFISLRDLKAPDAFAISRYEEVMISMENEIIELLRASFMIDIVLMFFYSNHQADQDALSAEAARYLEDDAPEFNEALGAASGAFCADVGDENCMQDDSLEENFCPCPMCHQQPLFYQMGWFLCVCGFRLNVKVESISMRQLKNLLERSRNSHKSSGCSANPLCVLKVSFSCCWMLCWLRVIICSTLQ